MVPEAASVTAPATAPANSNGVRRKRNRLPMIVLIILLVGAAVGSIYWLHARHFESTDDAQIEGHIVPISAQVAARVLTVNVQDNQVVKKGDLLVTLDPTDYQVAIDQAQGTLAAMQGKLRQAQAEIPAAVAGRDEAQAELDAAQTNFENADSDLKRYESLDERARSKEQYDNATAAQKSAKAQVEQAKAKLTSAESDIATAQAAAVAAQGDVEKAQADLKRAQVNLDYTRITASEDGRVTRKNVEPGSYVGVGAALLALVPKDVWVVADFKETQLTDMKPGQPVDISVDAYPDRTLTGHVESFQAGTGSRFSMLPPENATGNFVKVVQRVPVKILIDSGQSDDMVLAPGMSVEPEVRVR
jgi:membrane fusion protein (multidrug efflux system)